jgi:hypothetical protein
MSVAMFERPANYWYTLPLFTDGRKAIWDSINPHSGRRRIDEAFPHEMRESTHDGLMRIRYHNGSTFQVTGSDAVSQGSGIGSSVAGIVFSEFGLANPSSWGFYRPILEENNGWAAFVSTPRGRNHLLQLYEHAKRTPGWFAELLTADDTKALSSEALAETLKEYVAIYGEAYGRSIYDQEMFCSFNAATIGSFYGDLMAQCRLDGRISEEVVALPDKPVNYSWDLGVGDDTSIWAWQAVGSQLFVLWHYASSGVGLEHYVDVVEKAEREHGWSHGSDYVPHDAKVREFTSGRSRVETMGKIGLKPILAPDLSVDDGINAVRRTLPLSCFHPRCEVGGIDALEQYRREWDDDKKCFRANAVHDWTSHPADSFRYLALSWRAAPRLVAKQPKLEGWRIPPPAEPKRGGIVL